MTDTHDTAPRPAPSGVGRPESSGDDLTKVGASAWRSQVLRQAKRLEDEPSALTRDELQLESQGVATQARERVKQAQQLACAPTKRGTLWSTFRNWWTGSAVETAWDDLQTACEKLMLIESRD